MRLSVVVPCYNEEGNVELFFDEIEKIFKNKKVTYEVIFVNDGSKDNTLEKLKKIVDKDSQNVKVINFSRNFGKEAAMYAGLKESKGELVTIIDADLQQRPELILQMLDILGKNPEYDSVAAYQEERKEGKVLSFFKKSFYKIINGMSTVTFYNGASDFRLMKRCVVDAILELSEYNRFSKGLFSFVGFNTYYMPYKVELRRNGKTSWSFTKLFNYAIEGIVCFTTIPLRFPFVLSAISFLTCLICFIVFLIIGTSQFTTLLIVLLLLMSLVFLSIGILGEYVSKIYLEVKNRPVYIVKNKFESKKKSR